MPRDGVLIPRTEKSICAGRAAIAGSTLVGMIARGGVQPSLNEFIHVERRLAMLGRHEEEQRVRRVSSKWDAKEGQLVRGRWREAS